MKHLILVALVVTAYAQPSFEVASVKVHQDSGVGPRNSHSTWGPQGVDFGFRPLSFLIAEAYNIGPGRLVMPDSAPRMEGYDVVAKAAGPVSIDQLRLMLQSLLVERFHLKMHRESKNMSVYKMVLGKDGPKFKEADREGDLYMSRSPEGFVFRNAEMSRLAGYFSSYLNGMVVDETGLKGRYNYTVTMPLEALQSARGKSEGGSVDGPSAGVFSEALKQLGLRLAPGTASVEFLVVDQAERLAEN